MPDAVVAEQVQVQVWFSRVKALKRQQ